MSTRFSQSCWHGGGRPIGALLLIVAFVGLASPASGQAAGKKSKEPPGPDPLAEIEKMKAEFEQRLADQESATKAREDALKKEQAAAVEAARDEAEKRMTADRTERQAEVIRLQKALEKAAVREDERERNAPPSLGVSAAGLSLYGYVQADYQMRQSSEDQLNSEGQALNQDRFLIRRARLGLTMDRHYGEGRLEIDGNTVKGPAFRLLDAEASVKLPGKGNGAPPVAMATIGMFRIPFGREVPQDDRQRLFMERSTVARALFPGEFDLGARLSGGWQFIRYALAVQNGQPLEGSSFGGLDPNHQKDILGRLGIEHALTNFEVAAGFSGLRGTGFHAGAAATKPLLQWNDGDENGSVGSGEVNGSPGLSASPSSNFTRVAFGADLAASLRISPLLRTSLAAEFYLADDLDRAVLPADPKGLIGRSYRELGYYVSLIQEYGPWLLGVRYDYYNPDQDANKNAKGSPVPTDASYYTLAVVAGWAVSWGRLLVEYDHNRNHLGLDVTGMPANLADDAVIVRGEVRF